MQALQRDSGHAHAPLHVLLGTTRYRILRVYATPGTYPATTTIELETAPLLSRVEPLSIGQRVEVWERDPAQQAAGSDITLKPRLYATGVLTGETTEHAIIRPDPSHQKQYQASEIRVDKTAVFAYGTVRTNIHNLPQEEQLGYKFCASHRLYFQLGTHSPDCQDTF